MSENELTEAQKYVLEITTTFVGKLACSGVQPSDALYEGYKFAEAALRGDEATVSRMAVAGEIVGKAALAAGIHPRQIRAEMERKG